MVIVIVMVLYDGIGWDMMSWKEPLYYVVLRVMMAPKVEGILEDMDHVWQIPTEESLLFGFGNEGISDFNTVKL